MSSNLVRRTTIVTSLERAVCKMANGTGSKVRTGTAQNVCVCDFGDDVDDVLGEPLLPVFGGGPRRWRCDCPGPMIIHNLTHMIRVLVGQRSCTHHPPLCKGSGLNTHLINGHINDFCV